MDIEEQIKLSVLDEDHLADVLLGNEEHKEEIKKRVMELIENDLAEVYKYVDDSIVVLTKNDSLDVLSNLDNWWWSNQELGKVDYFLCKVKDENGRYVYVFD